MEIDPQLSNMAVIVVRAVSGFAALALAIYAIAAVVKFRDWKSFIFRSLLAGVLIVVVMTLNRGPRITLDYVKPPAVVPEGEFKAYQEEKTDQTKRLRQLDTETDERTLN